MVPSGDLEQAVFLVRDKNVDEVLKAQGKPVSEYTTYGPWYAINDITPVTPATPEGYIPSVTEVDNLDSVIQNDITARQYVIAQATQISNKATDKVGGDFSLTMLISYTLMKYTEPIAYVDQTTGEPVGQIEKISGTYDSTTFYPVIAPEGYEVVDGQPEIVNGKINLTFTPDMQPVVIYVKPIVYVQNATVTYQTADGSSIGSEMFSGNSGDEIAFDTADYVADHFAKYTIKTDETANGATYDTDRDSNQVFLVTLALRPVTTPVTPTGLMDSQYQIRPQPMNPVHLEIRSLACQRLMAIR